MVILGNQKSWRIPERPAPGLSTGRIATIENHHRRFVRAPANGTTTIIELR